MDSNWQEVKLGSIARVMSGFAFKSNDFRKNGIPVLKIKNIRSGTVDLSEVDYVDSRFLSLEDKYHVRGHDILISLTGSHLNQPNSVVGRVALYPRSLSYCLLNQRAGKVIVRSSEVCDQLFLFYVLSTEKHQRTIALMASGAASQANISPSQVESVEIMLPPIMTQRKIAFILSAYDDLIENNLRRIKILEEMAKTIYDEWFVKFRFPGYEKVKMVESELGLMPEGWKVAQLSQVSRVVDCLHSKKPTETTNPNEQYGFLLHIWNIPGGGGLDLSKKFFINEKDYKIWTKNIEVVEGDCVITNVGRVGDFAQIPRGVKAAIGRNMTAIRPINDGVTPTFLIEYLRSPYMDRERTAKVDRGTIMDSLNVKGIVKLLIPMPPKELMDNFENLAYPIRLQAQIIQEKVNNLRLTRDLLLPKLINGEIDVENLDIKTEETWD